MSKEEIKEDIINDINRLLNKDSGDKESILMNELFSGNGNQSNKHINQVEMQQPKQMQQQMQPHMQQQMQPHIQQQIPQMPQVPPQMQHMSPQMQQQMYQQQMQQQLQHQQMQQQQLQQQQIMQQKMQQQMFNQGQVPLNLQQQLPPQVQLQQQIQKQMQLKEHMEGTSFDINNIIYSNRDSLVLFLLYIILLTPQVNSLMNKIPNTSEINNYPNYIGILVRGIIFISIYIGLKKLNLL